jgi:hypothetical protein
MINLGDLVKDKVNGFKGVVLARMECLYEATACRVHPRELKEDGGIQESVWFEEDRLEVIVENAIVGFVEVASRKVEA